MSLKRLTSSSELVMLGDYNIKADVQEIPSAAFVRDFMDIFNLWNIITFWFIGRMMKSLCNNELSVIIVNVCDQFSCIHTKSKIHVVALSHNFISTEVHFCMY